MGVGIWESMTLCDIGSLSYEETGIKAKIMASVDRGEGGLSISPCACGGHR